MKRPTLQGNQVRKGIDIGKWVDGAVIGPIGANGTATGQNRLRPHRFACSFKGIA